MMNSIADSSSPSETTDIFLIAGEASGDRLGAALIRALRERNPKGLRIAGVGGHEMTAEGIKSSFYVDDLSIVGFTAIPRQLPRILRLMHAIAKEVVARGPDVLVIIDSPSFTSRIARRVRALDPAIAIVEYVSPQIWAWRPGRARTMRRYIDHILALLPFEPAVHQRLGGPPCTFVGHPVGEAAQQLRPNVEEARRRDAQPPVLLMLPGSRVGEIQRLLAIFSDAVRQVSERVGALEIVIPTFPHLVEPIRAAVADWSSPPRLVLERSEKEAAFRIARAALAKSGTVTLELAVAGIPMVTAYKVSTAEYLALGRRIAQRLPSVILANLVLGENVIPELLQHHCTSENLAAALIPLICETPQRQRQVEAFARLDAIMEIGSSSPAARAADIVLNVAHKAKRAINHRSKSRQNVG
jgi:lipid-A-disaccharide synthase